MSIDKKRLKEQALVNEAIASIKRQLNDLENSRKKFIAAAVKARKNGITSQYVLAKNAIRIVSAQKNVVEQMLLNLQISSQIKDVSEMTKTFADGMKALSGSIVDTTSGLKFEKVSKQMAKATMSTQLKQIQADEFLATTQDGFASYADGLNSAGIDDIDRLIQSEMGMSDTDVEIDELTKKLLQNRT